LERENSAQAGGRGFYFRVLYENPEPEENKNDTTKKTIIRVEQKKE